VSVIAVTMRRDEVAGRTETRDAVESSWWDLLSALGHTPLILPNHRQQAAQMMETFDPSAVILTGGGEVKNGATAGPRDDVETLLIDWAVENRAPAIGICRGMQAIALRSGALLKDVPAHVRRQGEFHTRFGTHRTHCYHERTIDRIPAGFRALGTATGGAIEAIEHRQLPIVGIMWHPERAPLFDDADIRLFEQTLNT
jgi:gamma-glutamyl-gamma-aminobutyrate hydrolase PuuD